MEVNRIGYDIVINWIVSTVQLPKFASAAGTRYETCVFHKDGQLSTVVGVYLNENEAIHGHAMVLNTVKFVMGV